MLIFGWLFAHYARISAWLKRNIISVDPRNDESNAKTRYAMQDRAWLVECPGEAPPVVVYGDAPEAVDAAELEAIEADLDETATEIDMDLVERGR